MEHLHLGPKARVARVRGRHQRRPLSTRLDSVLLRARVAPHAVPIAGEAAERDTRKARKACTSREDVRVRPVQHGRHHGAGGGASDEDAACVPVVLRRRVLHHRHDALGVAAAVVRQRTGPSWRPSTCPTCWASPGRWLCNCMCSLASRTGSRVRVCRGDRCGVGPKARDLLERGGRGGRGGERKAKQESRESACRI